MKRSPRRRHRRRLLWLVPLVLALVGAVIAAPYARAALRLRRLANAPIPDWIEQALIPLGNARSGATLAAFNGVVLHYVGNPGTSAMNNRHYFAQETTEVVSHFVVGLEGEIIQCLPLGERSAASNSRNRDTISIEICHPDDSGRFTAATYATVVRLTAWLCERGALKPDAVIRHYDVTGKECPRYYVRHPKAWEQLKADIAAARTDQ